MAGDVVWGKLLIFGGWDVNNFICNDIYMLSMLPGGAAWARLPVAGSKASSKDSSKAHMYMLSMLPDGAAWARMPVAGSKASSKDSSEASSKAHKCSRC